MSDIMAEGITSEYIYIDAFSRRFYPKRLLAIQATFLAFFHRLSMWFSDSHKVSLWNTFHYKDAIVRYWSGNGVFFLN